MREETRCEGGEPSRAKTMTFFEDDMEEGAVFYKGKCPKTGRTIYASSRYEAMREAEAHGMTAEFF